MADKGIVNKRGGQIVCSSANTVIEPGKNRVTEEQLEKLRADKFLKPYWDDGTLEEVAPPPVRPSKKEVDESELGNDARSKDEPKKAPEKSPAKKSG